MIRFRIHIVFSIVIAAMLSMWGCRGGDTDYRRTLLHAESITDSLPDSALAIVQSIPFDSIESDRLRALHSLVMAHAKYKLYIEEPADSLLMRAEEIFREENDKPRLMKILFLLAYRLNNWCEYSTSLTKALESRDIAKSLGNYEYQARASEQAGITLHNNCSFIHSLKLTKEAIDYYDKANMQRHKLFSLADCGKCYSNIRQDSLALELLDSICCLPGVHNDSVFMVYAYHSMIDPLIRLNKNREAANIIDSIYKYSSPLYLPELDYILKVELANDNLAKARELIDSIKLTQQDWDRNSGVLNSISLYLFKTGNSDSAYRISRMQSELQLSGLRRIMSQNLDKVCGDYSKSVLDAEVDRQVRRSHIFGGLLCAAVIILIVSVFIYRHRIRKRREAEFGYISRIKELCDDNEARLDSIFRNRIGILNGLCNEYFSERDAKDKIRAMTYRRVVQELQQFSSEESLKELERHIDERTNRLASKFAPFMKEKPVYRPMILFILAGLRPSAICMLCDLSRSNVYTMKFRLKEMILNSDSEDKSELLSALGIKSEEQPISH